MPIDNLRLKSAGNSPAGPAATDKELVELISCLCRLNLNMTIFCIDSVDFLSIQQIDLLTLSGHESCPLCLDVEQSGPIPNYFLS